MTTKSASPLVRRSAKYPGEILRHLASSDGWKRLQWIVAQQREHGDLVQVPISGASLVIVGHPDDVRDVLVTHGKAMHKGRGLERAELLLGEGLLTSESEFHLR